MPQSFTPLGGGETEGGQVCLGLSGSAPVIINPEVFRLTVVNKSLSEAEMRHQTEGKEISTLSALFFLPFVIPQFFRVIPFHLLKLTPLEEVLEFPLKFVMAAIAELHDILIRPPAPSRDEMMAR